MYLIKKPFFSLPSTSTQSQWNRGISFSMLKCRHMVQQNSFVHRFVWRVLCVCLFFLVLYLFVCVLVKHVSVIVTPIKFLNLESWYKLNNLWHWVRTDLESSHSLNSAAPCTVINPILLTYLLEQCCRKCKILGRPTHGWVVRLSSG